MQVKRVSGGSQTYFTFSVSDDIDMKLQGNVYHDVQKTYADDIRGIDIEELKMILGKIYLHHLHRFTEKD